MAVVFTPKGSSFDCGGSNLTPVAVFLTPVAVFCTSVAVVLTPKRSILDLMDLYITTVTGVKSVFTHSGKMLDICFNSIQPKNISTQ